MLIPGLQYIPDYISQIEQDALIEIIDRQPWLTDLKRRVQHYGYRYDYSRRSVASDLKIGALPEWAENFVSKLLSDNLATARFDQVIVNEYYPGQGIAQHIDCIPCFGDTIVALSLNSACAMDFLNAKSLEKITILLAPCSLLIMSGEARYEWMHRIPARKQDSVNGNKTRRDRRLSLTFRQVILNSQASA